MNSNAVPSIFDNQSLAALKKGLRQDDPQALKAAAQQFEAVFLQMMLKSMRATVPQEGVFDSEQTRFYQELLDSQLAQVMAAKGGTGLAGVIERQLSRTGVDPATLPAEGLPLQPPPRAYPLDSGRPGLPLLRQEAPALRPLDTVPVQPAVPPQGSAVSAAAAARSPQREFVAAVWPHAVAAAHSTGIAPQFLVGHAALESGWGRSEPRSADGRQSYNLFGIKAGSQWSGAVVEAATTEYLNGTPETRVERFRAYGSYAEAFADYARLLADSPRYAAVLGSQDASRFARGLQNAGYATDPAYADKLERVINGPALRLASTG